MMISGIHFGHPTRHWHPKIAGYTYGIRNGSHLIDLVKTRKQLKEAQKLVTRVRREGKEILFVGTKKQSSQRIKERAQSSQSFFVRERWLGGILTNWFTVQASLLKLHRLERDKKKGPWESLQKKEARVLQKRLDRLDRYLGGLKGIRSIPRVVILVGQTVEIAAIQECRKLEVPLICRLDTDCNPDLVEVGVPINDDSVSRIRLFLKSLLPGIYEGRRWWFSRKVRKQRKKGLIDTKRSRMFIKIHFSRIFSIAEK
jgi:small subunit ribosomal protein S2